jgi:ribonuclease D
LVIHNIVINKKKYTPASNNNNTNNSDNAINNTMSAVIQSTHKKLPDPLRQQNDDTTLMTLQDAIQNNHSIKWVRTCTDVQEVIKCIEGLSIVAVDTEHHNEKIVLLQIFTGQVTLLFDFVVDENDRKKLVSCLQQIMHDSSICKVFHDCRKDVLYLRNLGITNFAALRDTQVLHQLNMDLKGRKDPRIGLGNLLKLHQLEHKSKAEIQKKIKTINWSLRPLSEELIRYVAEDVVYLIELYNKLEEQRKKLTQAICDSYSTSKLANNNNIAPKPKRNDLENRDDDWLKYHKHDAY